MLLFVDPIEGWDADEVAATDALIRGRDWSDDARDGLAHAVLPLDSPDVAGFVAACQRTGSTPWVEVGDITRLREAARHGAHLWLRGYEAGGRCGEVGALVLIRAAHRSRRPWVAQGLGLRAMGAAMAVGAAGIVLDAHLWLLPDSPLHPDHKAFLLGRSGRDTAAVDGERTLRGAVRPRWWADPESGLPCPTCIPELPDTGTLAEAVAALGDRAFEIAASGAGASVLAADPLHTGRPLVQGPMANVSEKPGLARAVLDAGGLPFCALGALKPDAAQRVLDGMAALEGPWGVGVIGFDVMPFRDAHLDAVAAAGTRPVILAGGSPALAVQVQQRGLEPWLHTPSARLAKMALKRGVAVVVFEGREAGGHVGQLTSVAAWEEGLAEVEDAKGPAMAVLAGGIGDAVSAAFAATMACGAFEKGHRIALQVGTALFFTHEIVESQQITRAYQQAAVAAERTVLVGDTVNLPLQCAPNRYTDRAVADEKAWLREGLPLGERRERVERHNLGRTRVAAKGIERDGHGGYQRVPVQRQLDEGAYTMGQGALVEDRLTTVAALFAELTDGAMSLLRRQRTPHESFGPPLPVAGEPHVPVRAAALRQADPDEPIAVVGLGCALPGGLGVDAFRETLLFGLDAVRAVPDERWRADRYFDPTDRERTRTGTRMAGLVEGFEFDPLAFGIPPRVAPSMDRAQQLALVAAREAVEGVRIADRRRAAVVLGNSMGGEHAKSLAVRVRFREVLAALDAEGAFAGLDAHALEALSDRVEARLSETLPPVDVESMSGLLSNVIAGRVASWLDLMGGNLTVDAACAASLAAVETAVEWLRNGRCDVVLTGGVDADLSPETYVGFSRTHALSRTGSSPFSSRADGFVMGEGAAVFVLKRKSDAERDGDRIWALIRGIGQSSDGRSTGITAPRAEGQQLAIQRAYAGCDFGPDAVEMIEAHGTGTDVGDATELTALARVFAGQTAWLGSVKSGIGHLKGGAGAAGLLKAVLAVAHRVVPPTLHATPLRDELARSPFRLPRTPVPFERDVPRASVSAFGFGGTNFHVLVEGAEPVPCERPHLAPSAWADAVPELRVYAADDAETLLARFDADHTCTPEEAVARGHRLVVLDRPPGLRAWVASGATGSFGGRAWRFAGPMAPPVLVFPGQGSPRVGALSKLHAMPASAAALRALGVTDVDTSADPAAQHELLVTTAIGWAAVLDLPVAGVVGHSVGELGALAAAGVLEPADALELARARGRGLKSCPRGAMVAVALDGPEAAALAGQTGLHVAALNGPGASVLAGSPGRVEVAAALARERGIRSTVLDVERAFHTPDVEPAARALAEVVSGVPLQEGAPWWSNVGEVDDVRDALVRAVTEPVGFRPAIERAAAEGHRLFVHCGPGSAMARHIEKTVPGSVVVSLDPAPDDDGDGLVRGACALLALGYVGLLRQLPARFVTLPFPTEPRAPVREAGEAFTAPERAERPAPTAPAAVESESDEPVSEVRRVVLDAIFEITGYPAQALVPGARLDADLGIDSIRKMEIIGLVQDRLGLEIDDAALSELGSLDVDALVAWLEHPPERRAREAVPTAEAHRWRLTWLPGALPDAEAPGPLPEVLADAPLRELLAPWVGGAPFPRAVALDPDLPAHHGVAAFVEVAAKETGRAIRVVFLRGEVSESHFRRALSTPSGRILLDGERVLVPGHCANPVAHGLPDAPVVLASGGTTGILGPCLDALPGARGIVFGRRPQQSAPPGFEYVVCDVTDARAVAALARRCRETYGRIDVVVHAAGALRDGLLETRTAEDLDVALAAKLDGAQALVAATLEDAPVWVPFSSVSAHLANPGQSLYAAANAALEALVHPTATRSVPMVWTAWSEVGMAADPALQRLLASRGILPLSPATGAAAFVDALGADGPQWLAPEPPPTATLPWPLTGWAGATFSIALDPSDPVLVDHTVAGRPLVPAALWVSALLHAAGILDPGAAWSLHDLEILAPCFVTRPESVLLTFDGSAAQITRAGTVHCRASIELTDPDDVDETDEVAEPEPLHGEPAAHLYRDDLLFHGPAWQMLVELGAFETDSAAADVSIDSIDPLATTIDGAHQLLAAWSGRRTGWLGLPVGASAWQASGGPLYGPIRLLVDARVEDGAVLGEVVALDPTGRIVVRGSGVRLAAASRWNAGEAPAALRGPADG
ncbi:MAG: SDR family oxidoreductase [Alphaproteobacteria bacterium]|nr:SDR family oxidoreductase [Alphaproteobacteria bacterium]